MIIYHTLPLADRQYKIDLNRDMYVTLDDEPLNGIILYISGDQCYVWNGLVHRADGPAFVYSNGWNHDWVWEDVTYSFDEYVIKAGWTEDQIIEWKLTHATSS